MQKTVSPRQLARAIGASESSVKRWCDRGLLPILRTAGGHRRLPLHAVMQFLSQQRHAIVSPEAIGLPVGAGQLVEGQLSEGRSDEAQRRLVAALQAGASDLCQRLVTDVRLTGRSLAWICDELLAASLTQLGDGWCNGTVEIYEERRGCEIVQGLLLDLLRWIPPVVPGSPLAIGCALEGDIYALPTRMVELALREAGWQATSLGCNVPAQSLAQALRRYRPRLVWLSISHVVDEARLIRDVGELWQVAQDLGIALAVGGFALHAQLRKSIPYSFHGDKLQHLVGFVNELQRERSIATRQPTLDANA